MWNCHLHGAVQCGPALRQRQATEQRRLTMESADALAGRIRVADAVVGVAFLKQKEPLREPFGLFDQGVSSLFVSFGLFPRLRAALAVVHVPSGAAPHRQLGGRGALAIAEAVEGRRRLAQHHAPQEEAEPHPMASERRGAESSKTPAAEALKELKRGAQGGLFGLSRCPFGAQLATDPNARPEAHEAHGD